MHPWITIFDDHELTNDSWSDGAQKCYLAAKTPAVIKDCENKFPPAPPPGAAAQPTPTRNTAKGAGSAAR